MSDEPTLRERPTIDDWFTVYDPSTDENTLLTAADYRPYPESI